MGDPRIEQAKTRIGQVLCGKWTIEALVGSGGMATVYSAVHRNGKRVAIKMLHPGVAADPDTKARFLREGYVANKVEHPGCVSVLDDDTAEDGSVFLVMELLTGETLAHRAERLGNRMPLPEVVSCADQLLDVLAAAHDKGIIHRDIKPDNLFLTREGALKVFDFGLARLREKSVTPTLSGSVMGTPAFMPPEQAVGKASKLDGRADVWAVGATMFTLLTGRLVHTAGTVTELLLLIATRPVAPIAQIMPSMPPGLGKVIDKALAFNVQDRWPDVRTMQSALRAATGAVPPPGFDSSGRLSSPSRPDLAWAAAPMSNPRASDPGPFQMGPPRGSNPGFPPAMRPDLNFAPTPYTMPMPAPDFGAAAFAETMMATKAPDSAARRRRLVLPLALAAAVVVLGITAALLVFGLSGDSPPAPAPSSSAPKR